MTIGLAIYLWGAGDLPETRARIQEDRTTIVDEAHTEHGRLWLILLFAPSVLFWAAFEQQGNTIARWAGHFADRDL